MESLGPVMTTTEGEIQHARANTTYTVPEEWDITNFGQNDSELQWHV